MKSRSDKNAVRNWSKPEKDRPSSWPIALQHQHKKRACGRYKTRLKRRKKLQPTEFDADDRKEVQK